jgi:predicted transcriptional regulator
LEKTCSGRASPPHAVRILSPRGASNPFLLFIAFFVWIGAAQEASMTQMKSALAGIPVSRAMLTDFLVLPPGDPLSAAVEKILAGFQHDFPVLEGNEVMGVLTRENLMQALAQRGPEMPVGAVMRRDIQSADAGEMLETAFQRLQGSDCRTLPVYRLGRLDGLLTADNVGEFLMIQSALTSLQKHRRAS